MLSVKDRDYQEMVEVKARFLIMHNRRASFLFSFPNQCRASLSVEASLVLPLFLLYMMTLLYSLEIVRFQSDVWEALHQEVIRTGFTAYEACYGELTAVSDEEIKYNIVQYLGKQFLPYLCVDGNAKGIEISVERDFAGKDNCRLAATYEIKPLIRSLPIGKVSVTDSVLMHGFTGYQEDGEWNGKENAGVSVYITASGERYHFSENCTYLRVKLQAVSREAVSVLRNADGGKYYACEVCGKEERDTVYLAKWGDCYHCRTDCEAIKRTVFTVPLSQVGKRTACSKCG